MQNGWTFDSYMSMSWSPYNEHVIWHHINPHAKTIHSFHILTNDYVGHRFFTFELTKIHLKKHTWNRNISIRVVNQMHTWMQLTSSTLSKFVELVLQRSTNYSMLIWRQPTHQIPDIDKYSSLVWRISLFAKKTFTIVENWCTKQTLKSSLLSTI